MIAVICRICIDINMDRQIASDEKIRNMRQDICQPRSGQALCGQLADIDAVGQSADCIGVSVYDVLPFGFELRWCIQCLQACFIQLKQL